MRIRQHYALIDGIKSDSPPFPPLSFIRRLVMLSSPFGCVAVTLLLEGQPEHRIVRNVDVICLGDYTE